jgi:alkanesulfonate monooxygenase SsuD/methylene tetrahydromethanopterin reductase-like flavin-dependent oxidoreductase (luciferase family)
VKLSILIEGEENVSWKDWLGLAQVCESIGIQRLFSADHFQSLCGKERGGLGAWGVICALGTMTRRLRLGVLVSPPTFRHPSDLSRLVLTADHISGGRVEVGLGLGWNEEEHRAFGFEFPQSDTRLAMLAEQIEIVYRQWTEDVFDFSGQFYQLIGCRSLPKPLQGHIPIILGGSARAGTANLAVKYASEYNTVFGATPQVCQERRTRLSRACMQAGRDPASLPMSLLTIFATAATRTELRAKLERLARFRGFGSSEEFIGSDGAEGRTMLIGTPADVRSRLEEYAASGVEHVILNHLLHDDYEALHLLGSEVIPALLGR